MIVNHFAEEIYHKSIPVIKKPIPVKITGPFDTKQKIKTLESEVQLVRPGNYIVEGPMGEKYPISPKVFADYEPHLDAGKDMFIKKEIIVRAYQVDFKGIIKTSEEDILNFSPGYYIVMESPDNMWAVENKIFEQTYMKL